MSFNRRRFMQYLAGITLASPHLGMSLTRAGLGPQLKQGPFQHGVASGDPLHDRVILWTRITPDERHDGVVPVQWQMATDPEMRSVVADGITHTSAERDFTVKLDPQGLQAGTTYYYRFKALGHHSPIGRTKTLPVDHVERLRIAFTSCANYPYGYFNVYGMIAQRHDLDVVLHLGDYIYEYANGTYGDGTPYDRIPQPNKEIVTLDDYRQRFAQYRRDPDLQEAHRQHPFITVWDDHEVANDAWSGGAENHNPELGEGDWLDRRHAAVQAYYEWIPIRQVDANDPLRSYRRFRFGNLLDLIMLDTRLYGRDQQAANDQDPAIDDPARSLLGTAQEAWFLQQLSQSQADATRWRVVGQQVMFGQLLVGGDIFNVDQWDGYRASRQRVLQHLREGGIDNTVILTGDIHSSWAMDIAEDPYDARDYAAETGQGSLAVEFVTPAVTSPALEDPVQAAVTATYVEYGNPHMKFVELFKRGYVLLDIDHRRTQAEWYHAATITEPGNYVESLAAMFQTLDTSNHLIPADAPTTPHPQPPLPAPL
jgi:alkaline phosphatase D